MLEETEEFVLLIQTTENTQKSAKSVRSKLERPMATAMLWKRHPSIVKTNAKPKTMYDCIVDVHESSRQRAESWQSKIEDHFAGKGFTCTTLYNLVHKFTPMPQAMKIPDAKAAVDKEWKKLETIPPWDLEKVKSQEGGYSGSTKRKNKVHFATLIDMCHSKNAELEQQLQKYKGRVVLRGDIVKDDSGASAVFARQGSSAFQMTAAKIIDVIARLPSCDGRAADAVSAYTQVKLEDAPRLLKNSQIRMSMRKTIRRSFIRTWMGENSELGLYVRSSETRVISVCIRG